MIEVNRLDGKSYWVNPHMIESMESNPDLTLTMLSGKKIVVKNSPEDVITGRTAKIVFSIPAEPKHPGSPL